MAIPSNNRIDPIIDYCIKKSQALAAEIQTLHTDLTNGTLQTSSDLRDRYTSLYEKLVFVIKDLKPTAFARCNNMRYEEAAPLKANIDAAVGTLKTKHKNLVTLIHELFHENRFSFPNSLTDFECYCNWPRKFVRENAGWIIAASAAFVSIMTLTSFGSSVGPYLAKAPKFFGDTCRDLGDFWTNLLSSEAIKDAAKSESASTAGKISLIPALGYPAYRYLKEPIMKLARKCDTIITAASEAPMATFITAWALYYTVSRQMGFEGTFAKGYASPFHTRLMVTFVGAFGTPSAASAAKDLIDNYKNQSMMKFRRADSQDLFANQRNPFNVNPGHQGREERERLESDEAPLHIPRNRQTPVQAREHGQAPQREQQAERANQNPPAPPLVEAPHQQVQPDEVHQHDSQNIAPNQALPAPLANGVEAAGQPPQKPTRKKLTFLDRLFGATPRRFNRTNQNPPAPSLVANKKFN